MNTLCIYHNPRCSKSRQTLALLEEKGFQPEVIEYLKTPLNKAGLLSLLDSLGGEPDRLVRKKDAAFKELGLSGALEREQVAEIISQNPALMERPVVVNGQRAALGRPPEQVLEIL